MTIVTEQPGEFNTGFSRYPIPQGTAADKPVAEGANWLQTAAEWGMLTNPFDFAEKAKIVQELPAAFRQYNPVLNAVEYLSRPRYKSDPTFDTEAALKKDGLFDNYRDSFIGVDNQMEYNDTAQRIAQEIADRGELSNAGVAGGLAAAVAGIVSPTNLLPFAGVGSGVLSILTAAALGGLAVGLDEIPLQLNQETRTAEEGLWSIGIGTAFGATLGGAHAFLTRPMERIVADQAHIDNIPGILYGPASGGADVADTAAMKEFRLISAAGLENVVGSKWNPLNNPVVRVLTQKTSPQARYWMAQLDDAGLGFEETRRVPTGKTAEDGTPEYRTEVVGPIAAAPGGTVFSRTRTYWAPVAMAHRFIDDAYARYWFEKDTTNLVDRLAAGRRPEATKLSRKEFREAVADAMENLDQHEVRQVAETAKYIREKIYDPILQKGQNVGLFRAVKEASDAGESTLPGALSYLNRVYDVAMIAAHEPEFIRILSQHFSDKLQAQWQEAFGRFNARRGKDTQRLADMQLPMAQVEALHKQFLDELKALDAAISPEEDARQTLLKMARRSELESDKKMLEDQAASIVVPESEAVRKARIQEVKRRVRNLNKAVGMASKKLDAKLEKINRAEELQMSTLNRTVRAAQKFLKDAEKLTDKEFEKRISELRDDFAEAGAKFDRNEERIHNVTQDVPPVFPKSLATGDFYHGGPDGITKFTDKFVRGGAKRTDNYGGIFFSADPQFASARIREGGKLYRVALDIRHPLHVPDAAHPELSTSILTKDEIAALKKEGYDGVVGKNETEVVVFDGDQVKILPEAKEVDPLLALGERQDKLAGDLNDISEDLEAVELTDRPAARQRVQDALDVMLARTNGLNSRRAVRMSRLAKQAESLTPEAVAARVKELQTSLHERDASFMQGQDKFGVEWARLSDNTATISGSADFTKYATDLAMEVTRKIKGTFVRLPGMDIMQGERGAELARVLDIPAEQLRTAIGNQSFLKRDIGTLMHTYTRTMAPDIELARSFGEPLSNTGGRPQPFVLMDEEMQAQKVALEERATKEKWAPEKLAKRTKALDDEYQSLYRNMDAVVSRLRGTWGLPQDPRELGYRAGRIALNLSTLAHMGMVAVSSIPDVAQATMKYGLLRAFGDGYGHMIRQIADKDFANLTKRELAHTSAGFELVLHNRAQEFADIQNYLEPGSPGEKALEWATGKIGFVALFDPWTSLQKNVAGAAGLAKILDALEVVNGGKATARELADATAFLAQGNIDGNLASAMWREMTTKPGAGNFVDGRWWANTEAWNPELAQSFQQMLNREIDRTIVTPGVDRPLAVDRTMTRKLLFQFSSFGQAATTRVLMAGLQSRGAGNIANQVAGAISTLAFSTISYMMAAEIAGGKARDDMHAALAAGRWEKFADEAIARSGLLGQFSSLFELLAHVPSIAPFTTVQGISNFINRKDRGINAPRGSKFAAEDLWQLIAGPTFGSMSKDIVDAVTSIKYDENGDLQVPTKHIAKDLARSAPLHNHFLVRQFYDAIINAIPEDNP